jgi:hypothetical protein
MNCPLGHEVTDMRILPLAILVASASLAACATTRLSEPEKLALYSSHAGAPVKNIRYTSPISWDKVDGSHLLLTLRPNEAWLFRLPPTCLDWIGTGPTISISNQAGFVSAGFDRVTGSAPGISMSCKIEEIRPVDVAAVRVARDAMEASTP